jgi:hypothetical protein
MSVLNRDEGGNMQDVVDAANILIQEVTDAELALLAVIAIDRNDENTDNLLDAYEREAARRGLEL